jgi:hypothetical protein
MRKKPAHSKCGISRVMTDSPVVTDSTVSTKGIAIPRGMMNSTPDDFRRDVPRGQGLASWLSITRRLCRGRSGTGARIEKDKDKPQ